MLKRAAQQKVVAWLAFAAMALIVLMPVVSRSMPMAGMMHAGASGQHEGHAHHAAHTHAHHGFPGMPDHPDDPTAQCGYCVLFSHVPVVGFGALVVVPPTQLANVAPSNALERNARAAPLLSARPRGPPIAIAS